LRRNALTAMLLNHLLPVIADFGAGSMRGFADEWRSYDCLLGQTVRLKIGETSCEGAVAGIDDDGLLLLRAANGDIRAYASGDVTFGAT
jgi:BirA family transcriptional regulator, biotin operon repressor / biotin---[acetyl-CoA-carboxylase] ligase